MLKLFTFSIVINLIIKTGVEKNLYNNIRIKILVIFLKKQQLGIPNYTYKNNKLKI